jgi:uncharacterized membrane protein
MSEDQRSGGMPDTSVHEPIRSHPDTIPMEATPVHERYLEIDLFRGIAVIMMVTYHFLFDLAFFSLYPVDVTGGFWKLFAMATASLFLLLVGISLTISAAGARKSLSSSQFYVKYLKRGILLLLVAIAITLATWLYLGEGYIIFGILHLIGVSVIIAPFFLNRGKITLFCGIACIVAGICIQNLQGPGIFLPLGVHSGTFYSVDYTPIFPWFGLVLTGIYIGELAYPGGRRGFLLPVCRMTRKFSGFLVRSAAFLGKHSLLIYIIHQPIIILLLHPPW